MPRRLKNPRSKNPTKAKILQMFIDAYKDKLDDAIDDFVRFGMWDDSEESRQYARSVLTDALYSRFPKTEGRAVEEEEEAQMSNSRVSQFVKICSCGQKCSHNNSKFLGIQSIPKRLQDSFDLKHYDMWNCPNCNTTFTVPVLSDSKISELLDNCK